MAYGYDIIKAWLFLDKDKRIYDGSYYKHS